MKRTVSGIVLTLLLLGTFTLAFDVRAASYAQTTVYINSDGSVSPSYAPISSVDNVTYTLTGNITYPTYNGIVVRRSNILINGNGHLVQGNSSYPSGPNVYGLNVTDLNNVTIRNINIKSFWHGIYLYNSNGSTISGNVVTNNCVVGILLDYHSSNNIISGNTVSATVFYGIVLSASSDNIITENNVIANDFDGIIVGGDNTVVSRNNVTGNKESNGITISGSSYDIVSWNTITHNAGYGVYMETVSNTIILGNDITANVGGICLQDIAVNNIVTENNVTANFYGIDVVWASSNNLIFHNNIISSKVWQVGSDSGINAWDDGYPSGGNYWSDYNGIDIYRGPYQNISGSDGIGDTPYPVGDYNRDHYPFMKPNGWSTYFTMISLSLTPDPAYVGQTVTLLGKLTDHIGQPINSAKIYLYVNGSMVGTLSTNSSGWFQASSKVSIAGVYNVRAFYNGSSLYRPCNQTETLAVNPKMNTSILFTLSPNPAIKGQTVTLAGNLRDQYFNPIVGTPVDIYYSTNNGSTWTYACTIQTNSTGGFKAAGKLAALGTYLVGMQYKGNFKYNPSIHVETLVINS
jgi:parallel beta-helix repeat protein